MALPTISFNIGTSGLGQPADGNDHISGMLLCGSSYPSGFSSGSPIQVVYSLQEAEDLGIDADYSDGTAATGGGFTVTGIGADGNTIEVKVAEVYETISLGTYTKVAADSTVTLVGEGIEAAINAGTSEHGYSAINTAGAIAITAPKRIGKYVNSAGVSTVIVGTITVGTPTTFTGGAGSRFGVYHYHVSEFFRMNPQGVLYIGIFAYDAAFPAIKTIQNYAEGQIRQMMVYQTGTVFAGTQVTAIQAVCDTLVSEDQPLVVVYNPDITSFATLAALNINLNTLDSEMVSVNIGMDLTGDGNFYYQTVGGAVNSGGTELGLLSKAKVSDNIAWVGQYNVASGDEFDKLQFANAVSYIGTSTAQLNTLNTYKYNFLRKFGADYAGSYFNLDLTCTASTSDFARIRNNRTMQKATRQIRIAMLPYLNSPIELNSDGTLTQDVVQQFKAVCEKALDQMASNKEISQRQVSIDPTQDILSTNTLTIGVKIIPIGSAEEIAINIGFTTSF
jgi:DNA-binding transcriptional regulator of glucitol operon